MPSPAGHPWHSVDEGILLRVRLTPKSARDAVEGCESRDGQTHLKARVRAAPEKGKANAALERLIAKWLGVAPSCVSLRTGGASRLKTVLVSGDSDKLCSRCRESLAELG